MSEDLSKYDISMATHWLECAHAIGLRRRVYRMHCRPLANTKLGKLKLLVFGERNWKLKDNPRIRIRYVDPGRVTLKESGK